MAVATQRVVRKIMPTSILVEKVIEPKKLNVAAYARVSTDKEEQEDSFERQVDYYTGFINGNSNWNFAGIYADPGISGTKAMKRPDFMRMINDCREGKIDRILVKSLSRFARNTVDALVYIRELRELNVGITFEAENIDTLTPGGEVLLTILAAIAEQESRTISKNVKWSFQKKFESGIVTLNTGLLLGYEKTGVDENGNNVYEIIEEEAEIVRRIYREYLLGLTPRQIAALKKMAGDYDRVMATLQDSADVLSKEYPIEQLDEISDRIIEIQTEVMKVHRKKQQGKIDSDKYEQRIEKLKQELQENETKQLELQQATTKISHIKDWMKEFGEHLETAQMDGKYDGVVIKKLVNKIKMYDDRIVVEFKYGIKVEQEYVE